MSWKTLTVHIDIDASPDRRIEFSLTFASRMDIKAGFVSAADPVKILESGLSAMTVGETMNAEVSVIRAKQRRIQERLLVLSAGDENSSWISAIAEPTDFLLNRLSARAILRWFFRAITARMAIIVGRLTSRACCLRLDAPSLFPPIL